MGWLKLLTAISVICAASVPAGHCEEVFPCHKEKTERTCVNVKDCPEVNRMLSSSNDYDVKEATLRYCSRDSPDAYFPNVCCKNVRKLNLPQKQSFVKALPVAECGFSNINMLNSSAKKYLDQYNIYNVPDCDNKEIPERRFQDDKNGPKPRVKRMGGGYQSRIGQWPWIVLIVWDLAALKIDLERDVRGVGCLGVIINEQFVLTVAKCVYKEGAPHIFPTFVYLGSYNYANRKHEGRWHREKARQSVNGFMYEEGDAEQEQHIYRGHVFVHPQYTDHVKGDNLTIAYNIAMVKMQWGSHFKYNHMVQPICLPSYESEDIVHTHYKNFQHLTLASHGITQNYDFSQQVNRWQIRHAPIPSVDHKLCNFHTTNPALVYCAGGLKDPLVCLADRGAPLMILSEDGRWHLVGLLLQNYEYTRRSRGCYSDRKPSLYVNVANYMGWIKQVIDLNYDWKKPQHFK